MPHIIVPVPLTDETHQILSEAARRLARILSPQKAPDVVGLIQHELTGRSVRGMVDEYLDAIGFSPPVRLPHKRARASAITPRSTRPPLRALRRPLARLDPTRN